MAIQLRSIGANDNVISVSFNAGVNGDASRITITKLVSDDADPPELNIKTTINIGGMNFEGYLIGYAESEEPGKKTITLNYIDSSVDLDRACVVLYKRGIGPEEEYSVTKAVTVPVITFTYSGTSTFSGSSAGGFNFTTQTQDVAVTRMKSTDLQNGILGSEEWSASPCDSSASKYTSDEFLNMLLEKQLITEENWPTSFSCAYEGTFRSVLSSITSQIGQSWWWDWTVNKARIFNPEQRGEIPEVPEGCTIYKKEIGKTMEGLETVSSWQFQRAYPRGIRSNQSAKKTVIIYSTETTGAQPHPKFPSIEDMKEEGIPSYREYTAYTTRNLRSIGKVTTLNFVNQFILDWSAIAVFRGLAWIVDFVETFGLDITFYGNNFGLVAGSVDFRTTAYSLMGAHVGSFSNVSIYGGYDIDMSKEEKSAEIFYPAPVLNSHEFQGNSTAWKTIDIEISPSPERRGLNPYGESYEDKNGITRIGTWRSGSVEVEGDTDSPAWGESISDCLRSCSPDVLSYILDGPKRYKEGSGGWRAAFDAGLQIWSVADPSPLWSIGNSFGADGGENSFENTNDKTSVAGWTNPNDLPPTVTEEQQEKEEEAQEYDDPCESLVSDLQNNLQGDSLSEDLVIGNKDAKPGLSAANGGGTSASCGSASVTVAYPDSSSGYVWVIKRTIQYSVIAEAFQAGESITNTWTKAGSTTNSAGLSHQVIVTDITSDENTPTEIEIPQSIENVQPLDTLDITTDGFFMPITATLQALSANVDYNGLSVSYSYRQIAPQPIPQRTVIAAGSYNVDVNLS